MDGNDGPLLDGILLHSNKVHSTQTKCTPLKQSKQIPANLYVQTRGGAAEAPYGACVASVFVHSG
jgi:hypothetical protein